MSGRATWYASRSHHCREKGELWSRHLLWRRDATIDRNTEYHACALLRFFSIDQACRPSDCCAMNVTGRFQSRSSSSQRRRVDGDASQLDRLRATLSQYVPKHMITYKHLDGGIEFFDEIPKPASGKTLRRFLRDNK
ncbi:hypothetical protein B0H15DRAFT_838960 [Mycena belliarum]|uniref:AMP-binding enzyme C-terminal domain-containing protein n=1 Tax=Mycena belliarum TaxID=1033014 RepID=A0AAD6XMV2_9AGAR|nr:hypothetical protein B0H15DRAFT_838960 [Mycena belliae]